MFNGIVSAARRSLAEEGVLAYRFPWPGEVGNALQECSVLAMVVVDDDEFSQTENSRQRVRELYYEGKVFDELQILEYSTGRVTNLLANDIIERVGVSASVSEFGANVLKVAGRGPVNA
ncbi:hypothetical protein EDB89DRAFT_2066086 [Lactarius sanguifluus]|nr:hypothetical protein EDB89DRAFT_2066086 [Lactarius sanguifluus]